MDHNRLDIQHRGFSAYRELTQGSPVSLQGSQTIDTALLDCTVSTDWIDRIERAMPYLENAVHQNRQFILRQGETVPLERAKRVSRASVEHLARHSELIGGDADHPERIYISENVDTYTIYENRFLYMLLRQLEDFAGSRYQKITELASAFSADLQVDRQLNHGNRKLRFQLTYHETDHAAPEGETKQALERIRAIVQGVEQLLRTELMKEVSAAPLLKPPIARTNVLLHDPNFRVAMELHTYLTAYTAEGFQAVEKLRNGYNADMEQGIQELVAITSYLACRNLLEQELETRRQEAVRAENQKKLQALKARLGDISPQALAYIQTLEQQLAVLEGKKHQLEEETLQRKAAQNQLATAKAQLRALQTEAVKLRGELQEKDRQLEALTQQNTKIQETMELRLRHAELQQESLQHSFEEKLEQQRQEFDREYQALGEKCRLADALNRDLSIEQGCTKEEFGELEQQFFAFRRYYERQWRLTKKQIRKEQLWKK